MKKIISNILIILFCSVLVFSQNKNLEQVRFMAAGDLNLAHWITPILEKQGKDYPFKNIISYLKEANLVFSNLEAPFCNNGKPYPKNFVFKVPEKHVDVLKAGNINLVSLANNHILDYGLPCLESTIKVLTKENIHYAGAGKNFNEAHKPAIFEINSIKFAFFSYSMTLPKYFYATDSTGGTAYPNRKILKEKIQYYNKLVDFIIVSIHWGQELSDFPKEYQQNTARWAIDYGADLVLGHHPHILQGIEQYKNKLIIYSLANFVFASYSHKAANSMIVDLIFTKNGIINSRVIPLNVDNYKIRFQPVFMKDDNKNQLINYLNKISLKLNNNQQILDGTGKINLQYKI